MSGQELPFGIMHQQWAPAAVSDQQEMAETLEEVVLAEEFGFASFMFGEHHFQSDNAFSGRVPVPELVVARATAATDRILLGTGVKVLAIDPVWRTVESMLTLELITGGRSFYGLGAGGDEPEIFSPPTLDADGRRALFRAAVTELVDLLGSQGRSRFPKPLSPQVDSTTLVERLMVAARDTETIDFAGRSGLGFVVGQSEPAGVQADYVARFRSTGNTAPVRMVRIVVLGPDDERAYEIARPAYDLYSSRFLRSRYYLQRAPGLYGRLEPADYLDGLRRMVFVVGGPETVATQLAREQTAVGADRLDLMFNIPGLGASARRRSMRLFADEVAPSLIRPPELQQQAS